jgi:hypothetical protein
MQGRAAREVPQVSSGRHQQFWIFEAGNQDPVSQRSLEKDTVYL